MSALKRTSLRLSPARFNKVSRLKEQWQFESNDETIGFLLDIADAEKLQPAAKKHLAKLRVNKQRDHQLRQQTQAVLNKLTPEQINKLISGEVEL